MDTEETDGQPLRPLISKPAHRGTEAKLRVMLELYGKTGRIIRSCEMAGIGWNVHFRRMQSDPVYRAAFEEAEQQAAQRLEDKVYEFAEAGDAAAAIALLKRFRPTQYREHTSIEHSGSIDLVARMKAADQRLIALRSKNDGTGTGS